MQSVLLNDAAVLKTSAYIFAALGTGVLVLVGAATVSLLNAVRGKTTRLAERVPGWVLLPFMTTFFLGLLVVVLWCLTG